MLPNAIDRSSYFVTAAFLDGDGDPVSPATLTWSLTDGEGSIVNGHDQEALVPATSVEITLGGDDLIFSGIPLLDERHVLFEGTYSHSSGVCPIRDCSIFNIEAACS